MGQVRECEEWTAGRVNDNNSNKPNQNQDGAAMHTVAAVELPIAGDKHVCVMRGWYRASVAKERWQQLYGNYLVTRLGLAWRPAAAAVRLQ